MYMLCKRIAQMILCPLSLNIQIGMEIRGEKKEQKRAQKIYYFTNCQLFNEQEAQILYNYKYFIENVIMRLGEDWRIQSNLLAQDIIQIRTTHSPDTNIPNFNLFNQFLSAYLKNKLGKEFQYTKYCENQIQKEFLEMINQQFQEQKIHNCLTFKTLTLGYCITAIEIWNKIFKNSQMDKVKNMCTNKPFGKLCKAGNEQRDKLVKDQREKRDEASSVRGSTIRRRIENIDIVSSNLSISEQECQNKRQKDKQSHEWSIFGQEQFSERQLKQINLTFQKINHSLKKTQILSYFVSYVDELYLKDGKVVRIFSISSEFYLKAFIVWLIFNIKMFFSLSFEDYRRYFKYLIDQNWKEEFEKPLKKFQIILEREWNKLLKDFSVALHDDQQVLNILIQRVKKFIQDEWQQKIKLIKQNFH